MTHEQNAFPVDQYLQIQSLDWKRVESFFFFFYTENLTVVAFFSTYNTWQYSKVVNK